MRENTGTDTALARGMPQPDRAGITDRRGILKAAGLTGLALFTGGSAFAAGQPAHATATTATKTTGGTAMKPSNTALVLIEFQNDFTTPGGVFHDGVKGVMASNNMLANAVEVADRSRRAGVTVMHAPITFAEGYGELTDHPYGILKGVVDNKAFRKGSWGAEIVDALAPRPGDIVIEGKRGLDAFPSTNLDFILRSKGIETVVLAGFLTNCCVESTMRSAYERGFNVITLKDCTAALSQEQQSAAVAFTFPMFSHPMDHDEYLKQVS
jgi:nicotinamidase-related amidase